jgi:hypothetical protein
VSGVTFLGANNRVILKLSDPKEVAQIKVSQRLLAIRVAFTGDVDHGSLTTGRINEDLRKFSFLVQRVDDDRGYVPGLLTPESSAVTRFSIDVELQAFKAGEHRLTLFGDKDRAGQRPAVTGMNGLRLDGEPAAFPSGDGTEGGDFVIRFNLT